MGVFDWVGHVGDWFATRWKEDWASFGKTFKESWSALPEIQGNVMSGIVGMASAPFKDDADFWGSARLWLDNSINTAKALGGGTVGTLFQMPVLHEASWLLDKAYRYGVARPIATAFIFSANTEREAYEQGSNPVAHLWENLTDFNALRKAWNDSEYVTPGQAVVYRGNLTARLFFDEEDEAFRWAAENDPRTPLGQLKYNSEDAEFGLKYASGSLDFASNFILDPAHGLGKVSKLGKLTLIDKVSTARYVNAGKVAKELDTTSYSRVKKVFQNAQTPEEARNLTMPSWRNGGKASTILWAASRMSDDVYNDAWLAMRAFDPEALMRLEDKAPEIASAFGEMFAKETIVDWDYQRGNVSNAMGADALRTSQTRAFVNSFAAREGLWGGMGGIGVMEKMPRASVLSKLRAGYHSSVLGKPVVVGRLPANLMPSQGWTPIIDAMDGTGISLRQFKANLERAGYGIMDEATINNLVSQYGASTSDASRQTIAMIAETQILSRMLKEYGAEAKDVPRILQEVNRWRQGTRRLVSYEKKYMSEEVAREADRAAEMGRITEANDLLDVQGELQKAIDEGRTVDQWYVANDADGNINFVPLLKPIDPTSPVLRSQFGEAINMLDYRALRGALRWWKMMHPERKSPFWNTALGAAAKSRGAYDWTIGRMDFLSSVWKTSALFRPAQMFRNAADDVLRTYMEFGKIPLLLALPSGVAHAFKNAFTRGGLRIDQFNEKRGKYALRDRPEVVVEDAISAPHNASLKADVESPEDYPTWGHAFADGYISLQDYTNRVEAAVKAGAPVEDYERLNAERFKTGQINAAEFKTNLATVALQRAGRNTFRNKSWRTSLLKDLVDKHLTRREAPDYRDNPYEGGTIVVDPFTGTQPHKLQSDIGKHFDIEAEMVLPTRDVAKKAPGTTQSVFVGEAAQRLERFIAQHADDLARPDTLLALRVRADGHISVGFARAKAETLASETVKMSATRRIKEFAFNGIADIAHRPVSARHADGTSTNLGAVFGGEAGMQLQQRASARYNPATSFQGLVDDIDIENMLDEAGSWTATLRPADNEYAMNWERAVNAQVASDPVAQLFLQGKSDVHVIDQVENTAWGHKWLRALSYRGVAYADQIRQIEALVNTYVPILPGLEGAGQALRAKVLAKQATMEDLRQATGNNMDDMPEVHGQTVSDVMGNSRAVKQMRQIVRRIQRVINDMPVDKWARYPFMAMAYQRHGTALADIAKQHYGAGAVLPAEVVGQIKEAARESAYYDMRYRLYDTAQRNDVAYAMRMFMPFSAAMMDSYIKYGRRIRENPMIIAQGAYYWDLFEREGMVQDQDGNVAVQEDGGVIRWYHVDPKTGEKTPAIGANVGKDKYIQFQFPSALQKVLGKTFYGVDAKPVFSINKDTMNVFLNYPSTGPMVALPANEFALSHPEMSDDFVIRKFILPFGPTSERGSLFLPATVRNAWDAFLAEDGNAAEYQAQSIMQAELIGYELGLREDPPSFEEVRTRAAGLKALRFMSSFASPASFQLVSPYQPYVDAYRQLTLQEAEERKKGNADFRASEEFQKRYGPEFYAVMMAVTRNNSGLSATVESADAYEKYKGLIQQYPEMGGLIVGSEGAGAFNKAVYEQQKETPVGPGQTKKIRELMSLTESTEDLLTKTTWARYSQMMDLITSSLEDRRLKSIDSNGAKDLKKMRDAFIQQYKYWTDPATGNETLSPWYLDYKSVDKGKVERKFEALYRIAADDKLRQRDDIRGLTEYLSMRRDMRQVMQRRGLKSLDSEQAASLRKRWDRQVFALVESNPMFASLWNRWLSNDSSLDM